MDRGSSPRCCSQQYRFLELTSPREDLDTIVTPQAPPILLSNVERDDVPIRTSIGKTCVFTLSITSTATKLEGVEGSSRCIIFSNHDVGNNVAGVEWPSKSLPTFYQRRHGRVDIVVVSPSQVT